MGAPSFPSQASNFWSKVLRGSIVLLVLVVFFYLAEAKALTEGGTYVPYVASFIAPTAVLSNSTYISKSVLGRPTEHLTQALEGEQKDDARGVEGSAGAASRSGTGIEGNATYDVLLPMHGDDVTTVFLNGGLQKMRENLIGFRYLWILTWVPPPNISQYDNVKWLNESRFNVVPSLKKSKSFKLRAMALKFYTLTLCPEVRRCTPSRTTLITPQMPSVTPTTLLTL
jgi:hypothetical protein